MFRRYAIYVTPEGLLGQRGAEWLGWDMAQAGAVPHPDVQDLDVAKITKRPRKYGFHGTIKPPLVLANGTSIGELKSTATSLTNHLAPVTLAGLGVSRIGGFLALTPLGDTNALAAMAALVVKGLDAFRSPATPEEMDRRRQSSLSTSQERNLTQWGYPYVMDEFRFHITLTGPLKDAEEIAPILSAHFAPVLPEPYVIDHLTLAGEDSDGMFHSISRLPLRG
ncbi:DUF1045 domain-containing protein [Sulfitobacter sp.]|jgi:hypothetical protein|uniref:DUF1045 domain-containing protein n=1 Tax=Sulfitobacter sp. TaxID=1903071 RepID=UPI003002D6BE